MTSRSQSPLILYDVTRLVNRRRATIPTGIDRIDLQLAYAIFERFGATCQPVIQTGHQTVVLEGERPLIIELLQSLKITWFSAEQPSRQVAARLDWLGVASNAGYGSKKIEKNRIKQQPKTVQLTLKLRQLALTLNQMAQAMQRFFTRPGFSNTSHIVYVNASHQGVVRHPNALARLAGKTRLEIVSYIHDIMPIELPEYTRADQVTSLKAFLFELYQHPVSFAVNSKATAKSLFTYLSSNMTSEKKDTDIAYPEVIYPGIEIMEAPERNNKRDNLTPPSPRGFVMLGTIEPRKNHLMILNIWRELVSEKCDPMPHLHIIGRRGWDIENVVSMLDRCPSIQPFVSEYSDLDDFAVCQHLKSCTALLFPSFAEGLGLPLVEAAQLGVPVIASDLQIFRELVDSGVTYINPLAATAWKSAIKRAAQPKGKLPTPRLHQGLGNWQVQGQKFANLIEKKL